LIPKLKPAPPPELHGAAAWSSLFRIVDILLRKGFSSERVADTRFFPGQPRHEKKKGLGLIFLVFLPKINPTPFSPLVSL
jgi:hypothetical protein